jgi:hypothetical protein
MISRHGSQTNARPEVRVIGFEHRGHGMPAKRLKRKPSSCDYRF